MVVLAILLVAGIVSPAEAYAGFAHPATVTVGAMFVLSAGLERSGLVALLGIGLAKIGRRSLPLALLTMMVGVGFVSAFINNTAAVAILLPTVLTLAREIRVSPSKLLIPLSFSSLFGGTCTLIGTSTNILVSSLMAAHGAAPLAMFELGPMGLVFSVAGLAYMLTLGHRLLPDHGAASDLTEEFEVAGYLTEAEVLPTSPLIDRPLRDTLLADGSDVDVLAVVRHGVTMTLPPPNAVLESGDVVWIRCNLDRMRSLVVDSGLRLRPDRGWADEQLEADNATLVEAVVAPNSDLIGQTLGEIDLRARLRATVLAVRHHDRIVHDQLADLPLSAGDAVLVEVPRERIPVLRQQRQFVVVSDLGPLAAARPRTRLAIAIVTAVVAVAAAGIADIVVAATLGALAMVLTRCLSIEEAYAAIEWRVIFLLGGILTLGTALDNTGAAASLSRLIVDGTGPWGPHAVLAVVYLATTLLTAVMSNNATAVLMTPIAFQAAAALGIDPRPLVVAIAYAASASFMTPVGYQTNLLVYGPGGYRFVDYVRVGTPLNLLFWVLAVVLIPVFWGF
jgi:di/tricarboxylate transporter